MQGVYKVVSAPPEEEYNKAVGEENQVGQKGRVRGREEEKRKGEGKKGRGGRKWREKGREGNGKVKIWEGWEGNQVSGNFMHPWMCYV